MSSGIGAAAEVLVNLYLNDHRPKAQATSPDLVRTHAPQPLPTDTGSGPPKRPFSWTRGAENELDQSRAGGRLHFLKDKPHSTPWGVVSQGKASSLLPGALESSVKRPGKAVHIDISYGQYLVSKLSSPFALG